MAFRQSEDVQLLITIERLLDETARFLDNDPSIIESNLYNDIIQTVLDLKSNEALLNFLATFTTSEINGFYNALIGTSKSNWNNTQKYLAAIAHDLKGEFTFTRGKANYHLKGNTLEIVRLKNIHRDLTMQLYDVGTISLKKEKKDKTIGVVIMNTAGKTIADLQEYASTKEVQIVRNGTDYTYTKEK